LNCKQRLSTASILLAVFLIPSVAAADGVVVNRIYSPYVQPLEREIEWRFVGQNQESNPDLQLHSIGYGQSLSDRWAVEFYAIAQKSLGESLSIDTYELELMWQLTEQGEFAVDWGMLFELEREIEENAWEVTTQLLAARDLGRSTATVNLGVVYEWGERIQNEIETTLRAQWRYRLSEVFEPGLELHVGQDTTAIGPQIGGLLRASRGRKLRWELGVFAGVTSRSPDHILKANLEFEF
jgi:hypothetical protein